MIVRIKLIVIIIVLITVTSNNIEFKLYFLNKLLNLIIQSKGDCYYNFKDASRIEFVCAELNA